MRASLTSIRLRHVGHFHDVGPGGGLMARAFVLGALFDTCAERLALHSEHQPRPMSKPFIDVRDLQPTQYCVVRRPLPLPTSLTIAALTVRRWTNAESASRYVSISLHLDETVVRCDFEQGFVERLLNKVNGPL